MLYYTMPFVAGESLRERLAREGALPVEDALRIWRDVLDALAHAHASGVVHRDIKPGNILLSRRNALVIDFGIAGAIATASAGAQAPAPGLAIGTPAYMAPEQITKGSESDERVDVYQAGLVMYEMLSGRLPFGAASTSELLSARVSGDPLPLLRAGAPAELVELVMRCLARAPAGRPPSADAVLAELETAAEPQATPSSVTGSSRRGAQRFAPLGAALLALAVATFVVRAPSQRPFAPPSLPPSAPRHVPDIAAHEAHARGMDLSLRRTDAGLQQAVEHFERAIAIDPLYAAPHAGLAIAYLNRQNRAPAGENRAWLARSEQAALRAVALDDFDAEALTALGWVRLVTRDYEQAEAALTRAVALDPRVSRGHEGLARLYMMVGRPAEQLAHARAGLEVVPFSHSAIRELALALATNGRCEEAIERLRPLKSLTPPAGVAGVLSGQCYASLGRWPEAIAELQWALDESDAAFALAFLGHALARGGRRDEASRILSDLLAGLQDSHGAFGIATIYAGLREYDQAFAWLDQAIDEESVNPYIMHPVFGDLHRDSRFDHVLERLGVPPS
jgi:tetratricopeptide (TPR) repeat protein